MKRSIMWGALALAFTGLAWGGPLPRPEIAADAKWVMHLDADLFRDGKLGRFFVDNILVPKTGPMRGNLERELGFNLDFSKIHSLTAFGHNYQPAGDPNGLIILNTSLDLEPALQRAIDRAHPALRVRKVESAGALYRVNEAAHVAFAPGGKILVGKTQEAIEKGRDVLAGRASSLGAQASILSYPEASDGFFFLAVAEGFGREANIPPQAAMLSQADGARVMIGENDDRMRMTVDVKAQSPEAASQIQQVAQGLIALVALSDNKNPELRQLASGSQVRTSGRVVTLALELPLDSVMQKIQATTQ